MSEDKKTIHQAVKEFYSQQVSTASCCGSTGCDCGTMFYEPSLIASLDDPASIPSFGCGDPVTIAGLDEGLTVLDLGSGAGLDCFLAARQVGPEGKVIGVDMTPDMLVKAEANRIRLGLTNVVFREGFIEALPVEDESIDVVISNCVINLSPDKQRVFNEAYRVLKKGGKLAVSDIVTEGSFSEEDRQKLTLWAECVSGASDIQDYTGMIARAGFTTIEVKSKEQGVIHAGGPRVYSARFTAMKPQ